MKYFRYMVSIPSVTGKGFVHARVTATSPHAAARMAYTLNTRTFPEGEWTQTGRLHTCRNVEGRVTVRDEGEA